MKVKCPLCDFKNEEGSKFCKNCNEPLSEQSFSKDNPFFKREENKDHPEEAKAKNKIEKERKMRTNGNYGISLPEGVINCPECGIQNPDDAKYCKECGTEIWYYRPIQKLPASEITVEILFNNITRSIKQYKISDFTHKVLEEVLINYISDPTRWPSQFHQMYFKNCNLYDLFAEFQAIVQIGYYLAIAIEKTTGKIIDIPIEIIDKLEVDYSAKWICDFSHNIDSKGTEIIENLFKEDDSLSRYFNNMFPVSDNIISEVLMVYAEKSYKTFMSKKQLKREILFEIEQDIIAATIYDHISWGLWIRFTERIAEIYRDTHR